MQRRLTLALVATALAAVVLVGLGVLGLASVGAEREAEERVDAQLDAIVAVIEQSSRPRDIGPAVRRLADAFDVATIDIGILRPDGTLRIAQGSSRGLETVALLSDEEMGLIEAGDTLFTRVDGRLRGVRGVEIQGEGQAALANVVVVETTVAAIGREARVWFVLSGVFVILGAALAAAVLARRLVRPIREATDAARTIASGDLGVRVPVSGNDELAALGTGINEMASELERGRAAEQQFLLSVSHDLRTPLTALRGYGEALEDGTATDPVKAGAVISHHAQRLGRLVGDLLDLGKLEARQFRFDTRVVDAAEIVASAAGGARPQAEERSLSITAGAETPAMVSVDPDRLGQVVGNLLENAIAFATESVEVSVATHDGRVTITVADDGPGIADEDLPHVFERLYVTKLVPERSESSSGLGLAIVRELTQAMGGSVYASRRSEGGTMMVVQFPEVASGGPVTPPTAADEGGVQHQ